VHQPAISQVIDLVVAFLLFFPEGQVLLEKLDDALGIAEVVLLELVNLVESLLEGRVSELASLAVVLQDFVVEDGEVEGEAELDWVARRQFNAVSLLVSCLGCVFDLLELIVLGILSNVTIVVTDHLDEESLSLVSDGNTGIEDADVDHVDDLLAIGGELCLDLGLVGKKCGIELGILGVLLDCGDSSACGALAADKVLEGDGEEVALVGVDSATLLGEDGLKELDHILEALGLLSNTGEENFLFDVDHLCKLNEVSRI
jgi:hypothetical protein